MSINKYWGFMEHAWNNTICKIIALTIFLFHSDVSLLSQKSFILFANISRNTRYNQHFRFRAREMEDVITNTFTGFFSTSYRQLSKQQPS